MLKAGSLSDCAEGEGPVCQHHFLDKAAEAPGEDARLLVKHIVHLDCHKRICYPLCHLAVLLRKALDLHPRLDGLGDPPSVLHAVCHWHEIELVGG